MDIQFGNLLQLSWLWLVLFVAIALVMSMMARRRAIKKFTTTNLIQNLFPSSIVHRQLLSSLVTIVAMCLLVVGLVDVRWGKRWREVPQKGIDIIFALDISRSMLASDASPNRLERAKQQIKDMVDEMAGDRVGLVVFAGDAKQQVPLTKHYHDFKNVLDEVGVYNVDRGGSQLGNAIQVAADCFLDKTDDHKAIVIFTDGEDQESDPVNAARQAFVDRGIRIFTVGLGDRNQGARVPVAGNPANGKFLEYQGKQVWSKLNNSVLEQVALATDGAYVPAETKSVNMANVYHQYVANVEQQDFETARINSYIPRYQVFVAIAVALVLLGMFWPGPRKTSGVKKPGHFYVGRQYLNKSASHSARNDQKVAA